MGPCPCTFSMRPSFKSPFSYPSSFTFPYISLSTLCIWIHIKLSYLSWLSSHQCRLYSRALSHFASSSPLMTSFLVGRFISFRFGVWLQQLLCSACRLNGIVVNSEHYLQQLVGFLLLFENCFQHSLLAFFVIVRFVLLLWGDNLYCCYFRPPWEGKL